MTTAAPAAALGVRRRDTIIDNDYVTLWFYPETRIVHHQMKRFVVLERFQEFLTTGARLLREHGGCKWLSDDRNNPVLAPDLRAWSTEHWVPPTIAAGWKYWAILAPEKDIGLWSMRRAVDEIGRQGVKAHYFLEVDEALRWLESQT
jgi:hypothetical protein